MYARLPEHSKDELLTSAASHRACVQPATFRRVYVQPATFRRVYVQPATNNVGVSRVRDPA